MNINLTSDESEFLKYKSEPTRSRILKHIENGLNFDHAVITEAQESLTSYYDWVKNNIKDEDRNKFNEWSLDHVTNYTGDNLTPYEKSIFDKLPDIGKWQCGNYPRMWRAIEEADESLVEFIHNELNYLCQPPTKM
jgi:hypothetical protein